MEIEKEFDAILMLTWSDFKTEPRSNRYHYATRFAKNIPVLFLQNQSFRAERVTVEASGIHNLDIVNVSTNINSEDVLKIRGILSHRGIKRPLIWVYDSVHYMPVLEAFPNAFRVYHATEDYFTKSVAMPTTTEVVVAAKKLMTSVDLVVAVSQKVLTGCIDIGGYTGASVVAENGCDYEFFAELKSSLVEEILEKVAIYQGGLNARLDYDLLSGVVARMPDWRFKFCGRIVKSPGWAKLSQYPNVEYLGELSPEDVGRQMLAATVGIIPFIQDDWIKNSLPLKTFEYIACGLPVVSVPIDALSGLASKNGIVKFSETVAQFATSIVEAGGTRHDPVALKDRMEFARSASYDQRYEEVCGAIVKARENLASERRRLDIAMLYDPASCHVSTVKEHLESYERYSANNITYIPAANRWDVRAKIKAIGAIDLTVFDVVVVHYSIRLSTRHHFVENLAAAMERFGGLKVLFIQDEYEGVETARVWMDRLKFDVIYTCVPLSQRALVYPDYRYPYVDFLPTLTGYVPEDASIESYARPISERNVYIGYRGRQLPAIYGRLGQEKMLIGVEAAKRAAMLGLPVDIAVDEESRIYGNGWYEFLGSVRATLGTESGSNVFDMDGMLAKQIRRLEQHNKDIDFEELWSRVLLEHDGLISMNQISPKVFEAIRLRTALVLFEGAYSGVVQPDVHYIPLKKDFSNFEVVVEKIKDDFYVRQLTERAYQDIVGSGLFSYKTFVTSFDEEIRKRCYRKKKRNILYGAVFRIDDQGHPQQVLPPMPLGLPFGAHVLNNAEGLQAIQEKSAKAFGYASNSNPKGADTSGARPGRIVIRFLESVRNYMAHIAGLFLRKSKAVVSKNQLLRRVMLRVYLALPENIRMKISDLL